MLTKRQIADILHVNGTYRHPFYITGMMKRWMVCILLWPLPQGYAQAETKLVVDESSFDFGMVPQHSTVAHRFWLKSAGTDTVQIQDIKTGCGCVATSLETEQLVPGDSLPVTFHWDTRGCEGATHQILYVFANASPDPCRLHLLADCRASDDLIGSSVRVSPSRISVDGAGGSVGQQTAFFLTNLSDEDMSATVVSSPTNRFEVVVPDSVSAGQAERGYVLFSTGAPVDELPRSITLEFCTDGAGAERVTLAFSDARSRADSNQTTINR